MPLSRRRLLAGLSCLPLGGCAAGPRAPAVRSPASPASTRRSPGPSTRAAPPVDGWRAALGPLDDVAPALRPAFTDVRDFSPMPPRRRGDWRTVRPEPAQSVAEFLASAPNFRAAPRERLVLLPLGRFPFDVVVGPGLVGMVRTPPPRDIAALLAAFFATPTEVLAETPLPDGLPWRRIHGHRQHDARALLDVVAPRLPSDAYGMLTLVTVDLYVEPEQKYAFGWSTFRDRLAVTGFARFDPGFFGEPPHADTQSALLRRGLRVAVHEVGHLFGLAHCQAFHCVMNGVADVDELDAMPLRLCPLCLRKLHLVTDLDLHARDEALREVFAAIDLPEETAWIDARARRLRSSACPAWSGC